MKITFTPDPTPHTNTTYGCLEEKKSPLSAMVTIICSAVYRKQAALSALF